MLNTSRQSEIRQAFAKGTCALSLLSGTSFAATSLTFGFNNNGSNLNLTDSYIEETIVVPNGPEAGTYVLRATHSEATAANPVAIFNLATNSSLTSVSTLPVGDDFLIFWQGGSAPAPATEQWDITLTRDGNPFQFDFTSVELHLFSAASATFLFENELGDSISTHITDPSPGAGTIEVVTAADIANATDISTLTIASDNPGNLATLFNDLDDLVIDVSAIPEPSSSLMLLGSLALFSFRSRRA